MSGFCSLIFLFVCLSRAAVIGIRGMHRKTVYRSHRLAAVVACCSGAATRHAPLMSQAIISSGHAGANLTGSWHLVCVECVVHAVFGFDCEYQFG